MDYDVIVIGSGIGGLTTAALLSKAGKSVLALESHDKPGGYAHGFKRRQYRFDSGVHLVSGCGSQGYQGGQAIYKLLKTLGLENELDFFNINPFSYAIYPDYKVAFPQTIEAFVDALSEHFPKDANGLRQLTELCLQITEQTSLAESMLKTSDYESAEKKLSALFQYRKATLSEVSSKFIQDPKLRQAFASNWPYLGLPPSQVSFVYWACMLIGYMMDGSYYCKGSFQKLANALAKGLKRNGGKIQFNSTVDRILLDQNRVKGVSVNGQIITSPIVISNADIQQTLFKMVGAQHFPKRYLQRITSMQHSLSIFVVYIATDLDLSRFALHHESFYYQSWNHEHNYQQTLNGQVNWISITSPTLIDSSLAPNGEHLLLLTTLLPYTITNTWQAMKPVYIDKMVAMAEKIIPGLKEHIRFIEGGSPATMERYTQNHQGAAYGWNVTPNQIGSFRLPNQAPISGLYFAGHWCSPGSGVYGACLSGIKTSQSILGYQSQQALWQDLQP